MLRIVSKFINYFFYFLFFITPLILFPKTSEIFEFNKIVVTYLITILIISLWIIKMILLKKIIFYKTILDIPLIIFFCSQLLSTIFSIDSRTSIFGYYSRFNGGLLSTINYLLLYWAYVSNVDSRGCKKSIFFILLSSFFVSIYAILQHFGIDKNIWVQDVQSRVFSTLGQPNWLAAWVAAIIPFTWIYFFEKNSKKQIFSFLLFLMLLNTLIYSKSRSGFLGFSISILIFDSSNAFLSFKKIINKQSITFIKYIIILFISLLDFLIMGTPWTPGIERYFITDQKQTKTEVIKVQGPALETGGTDSGKIRKIVWRGAINIWKDYPILGSGVETFAFAYYQHKPPEHNLVSEWDFLYDKAHNEYLNILATSGMVGLLSYLILITVMITAFLNKIFIKPNNNKNLHIALLSGFISILITNFFGFSVVAVSFFFFLFPAISFSLDRSIDYENIKSIKFNQKLTLLIISIFSIFMISQVFKYWLADYNYARSRSSNDLNEYFNAQKYILSSINAYPREALYRDQLSKIYANLAVYYSENNYPKEAESISESAISEAKKAISLSEANVNLKRNLASIYVKLVIIKRENIQDAIQILNIATLQAPTDTKLLYNLGLAYIRAGDLENAEKILSKTITIKENYRSAHYALGLVYFDLGKKDLAKEEMKYILNNINPNDEEARKQLSEM